MTIFVFLGILFALCSPCLCLANVCISLACLISYIGLLLSFIVAIVFMIITLVMNQMCYSINGIDKAPFVYFFFKSYNLDSLDMAGTCLYGDGNLLRPMMGQFNGMFAEIKNQLPLDPWNTVIDKAATECRWS